ncbi:hypothetical protein JL721_2801 [Aureococcus anophagefferens]|nr:hypothetical protein JL721_2801 [Aureococcus anophagefferens]
MDVVLKYVPRDAALPPMELRITLPEKTQKRTLENLLKVVAKTYKSRHDTPFDDGVQFYHNNTKLDGDAVVGEVLTSGVELLGAATGETMASLFKRYYGDKKAPASCSAASSSCSAVAASSCSAEPPRSSDKLKVHAAKADADA